VGVGLPKAVRLPGVRSAPWGRPSFSHWEPLLAAAVCVAALLVFASRAEAQASGNLPLPRITVGVEQAESPQDVAVALQIIFILTILSLAPAILIMMTSFTRIVIVLSFLRKALGTQQTPPNQVIIGLALFMTFFVMSPVFQEVHEAAIAPYLAGEIQPEIREKTVDGEIVQEEVLPFQIAMERAAIPIRRFMWSQIGTQGASDVALFMRMGGMERPAKPEDVPTRALIPAFIISELKIAFQIGFLIFMPFLIIDMVTASVLMSMGMLQLPPILISLPFKILLFVLVDGWHLLVRSLGESIIT
jgi:flagellar biosynthetic protein FliP